MNPLTHTALAIYKWLIVIGVLAYVVPWVIDIIRENRPRK